MEDQSQSLMPVFLLSQLEKAANRALKYAPLTRVQLARLRGRSLAIELQRPSLALQIIIERRQIRFHSQWDTPCDVTIAGPAVALLGQLGKEHNGPADLIQNNIEIEGDQELAQQFIKLIKDLDIDFDSILGDFIGDMAAHQIGEFARTSLRWFKQSARSLVQQTQRFVVNERDLVVKPHEFQRFQNQVDSLREDTDRLEARLQQLKQRHQKDASQL